MIHGSERTSFLEQKHVVSDLGTKIFTLSFLSWDVNWNLLDQSLHHTSNNHCLTMGDIWSRKNITSWRSTTSFVSDLLSVNVLDSCIGLLVTIIKTMQDLSQSSELNDKGIDKLGMLLLDSHIMSTIHVVMLLWADNWEIDIFKSFLQSRFVDSKMFLNMCLINEIWVSICSNGSPTICIVTEICLLRL